MRLEELKKEIKDLKQQELALRRKRQVLEAEAADLVYSPYLRATLQ